MTAPPSQGPLPSDPRVVADRLHSAAIHLLRNLRREDLRTGVGPAQLSALSVLVFGGPMTLKRLAEIEQVTPPTMSRIVAALERQGWIARAPDSADGRALRLRAMRKGERLLQRARRRRIDSLAGPMRRLSVADRRLLARAAEWMEEIARRT